MNTLHYIFDPFCGWCYAAAPLLSAAHDIPGLRIALHAGGMMSGANRRTITPQWRSYVLPHDQRIARLTGQPFGEAYFEGLLRDTEAVMDSTPPTIAILAAEQLAARGLEMLHRLQQAHYVEGRRIADTEVLQALAQEIGLDAARFRAASERLTGAATDAHIQESHVWLARAGGQGFPTLALELADGSLRRIEPGEWLGRPAEFAAALRSALPENGEHEDASLPHCGLDGCTDA